MQKLSFHTSPAIFTAGLCGRKEIWRKSLSGLTEVIKRRRVHDLTRNSVRRYKRISKNQLLPQFNSQEMVHSALETVDPAEIQIVIMPSGQLGAQSETTQPEETSRKRLRRVLYLMAKQEKSSPIELLSSDRVSRRGKVNIGNVYISKRSVTRGIYLKALGVALLPNLSDMEKSSLEEMGAIVLQNSTIAVDVPACTIISSDKVAAASWHLEDIKIACARDKGLTGKGVLIGVVDTGIDADHPEFAGKQVFFQSFKVSGDKLLRKKAKDYGNHGTHVSGLCAGKNVGVAPEASLAVAAVLTQIDGQGRSSGSLVQILAGINWLAQGGAELPRPVDIINASLGSSPASNAGFYATVLANRLLGIPMVASVGNDGRKGLDNHTAPGSFEAVISIGASDVAGQVADFSAWGATYSPPASSSTSKPDLLAPGVKVVSSVPGGKYAAMDGTSMAAPVTSGAAALLLEKDTSLRHAPDALVIELLKHIRVAMPQAAGIDPRRCGQGNLDLGSI